MKLVMLAAVAVVLLGVCEEAAPAPREPTRTERLAKRILENEARIRATKDPAERQRLADEVERLKHEMGPRDHLGDRVRAHAMWHDAMLESLETDLKRLAPRVKAASAAPLSLEARLSTRKLAARCLEYGWILESDMPRFQFDAYGQYLANNLPMLDAIFDSVGTTAAKEEKAAAADPARKPLLDAINEARAGVGQMDQASNGFCAGNPKDPKSRDFMVESLGGFAEGLRHVCDAYTAMQDLAARPDKGPAPAATPSAAPGSQPEPAVLTAENKAQLARVRGVMASLDGPDWQPIRTAVERFTTAAEQGMKATIPMLATKGRASYLGERSIGHQDPGATSSYLMLKCATDTWSKL
jgi:hypothetical protein